MIIYTAGAMGGHDPLEVHSWRVNFEHLVNKDGYGPTAKFLHPTSHFCFDDPNSENYDSQEVMAFDLNCVRRSDIIVVNLNYQGSIGTAMELAIAKELGKTVIGFGHKETHPWVINCCTRIFDTSAEAAAHIVKYYFD